MPHEYLFITTDNNRTRIGEFVYYRAKDADQDLQILGTISARRLIRNLPDAFLADPNTPPALVSSLIGVDDCCEIYEIAVETIGYFHEKIGDFVNPRIPPVPGDAVFLASSDTLAKVLSPKKQEQTGAAHIGSLLTRSEGEVPVVLSIKDVVSTHLAILASTGSGKSYTAGVLIEELMRPHNRAAVLIIDPHGEYHTLSTIQGNERFRGADGYQPEVKIFTHEGIKVRFSTLTEADIKYLLPEGTSEKMLHFLHQAFGKLADGRKKSDQWAYHDLRDEIAAQKYGNEGKNGNSNDGGNVSSIEGLLWRMDSRFDKKGGIFHDVEHLKLKDLFLPGRVTILNLSDIEQNEQQVIVGTLLRRVNKARMMTVRGEVLNEADENYLPYPVFTLLEEAHRFAPAGTSVVSTNILKQILSEGRKFGVGIGLITQRPGKLDQDVLSQCMTQIIMRIVNPIDQQTVAQSVEGAGRGQLDELPALTKGQAVISGVGVNTPVMCRIRQRLTVHGGETIDAPDAWAKWFAPDAKNRRMQDEAIIIKNGNGSKPEKHHGIRI